MIYMVLLLVIIILFTKRQNRNLTNPLIVFSILWTTIVALSQERCFDLYEASDLSFLIILIGVVMFAVGTLLSRLSSSVNLKFWNHGSIARQKFEINYVVLYITVGVCILYYLPQLIVSIISMLRGVSLNDVRGVIQTAEQSTGITNLVSNYIILPFAIAAEPVGAFDFWLGKRDKRLFSLVFMLVLVRTFGDGGRTPLFNFVIYFAMAYLFKKFYVNGNSSFKTNNRKEKRTFRRYVILGILGVACVTLMRAGGVLIRKAYFYFAMSPVLLTRWIEMVEESGYHGNGLISFNGIFYLFDYLRKNLFGLRYNKEIIEAYELIASTDSTWLRITSSGTTANAYVSCFWFFYADARMLGVVVLSCLYGFIAGQLYYRSIKYRNPIYIVLYLLVIQSIFFSFIRFPFGKAYYFLAMLIIRFLFFRHVKTKGDKCTII